MRVHLVEPSPMPTGILIPTRRKCNDRDNGGGQGGGDSGGRPPPPKESHSAKRQNLGPRHRRRLSAGACVTVFNPVGYSDRGFIFCLIAAALCELAWINWQNLGRDYESPYLKIEKQTRSGPLPPLFSGKIDNSTGPQPSSCGRIVSISNESKNDFETPFENNDNVSVSMVVIASHRRSSSTFLAFNILQGLPCHLSLNEILTNNTKQAGDAWATVGEELHGLSKIWGPLAPSLRAAFVLEVARRKCRTKLRQEGERARCHNHCWVNFKHFPTHQQQWNQHHLFWNALLQQNQFNYNPPASFSMVILERDVRERFKSFWFAEHTGDWDVQGTKEHKQKIADIADRLPSPVPPPFREEHRHWHEIVRSYANETLKKLCVPVADLSFSDITGRPVNVTQQELQNILLSHYSPEYPPMNQ